MGGGAFSLVKNLLLLPGGQWKFNRPNSLVLAVLFVRLRMWFFAWLEMYMFCATLICYC